MAIQMVTAAGLAAEQGPGGVNINAEDVLDLIIDLTPWENPVVTMMPKVQATSTTHEWIEDSLNTISPRHGIDEGVDFGDQSETTPTKFRKPNFLQHFRYEVKVSNLQRLMNPYGIQDQYAFEVGKRAKQIGKDIEARLLEDTFVSSGAAGTFQGIAGGGGTVARMKNLIEMIAQENHATTIQNGVKSNIRDAETLTGLTAATQIWNGTLPATLDATASARLTELRVNKALELMHGNDDTGGAHPDTMIVNPASYGHIGAFGNQTPVAATASYPFPSAFASIANGRLSRVVRFYDSQFGLIEVVNSRWVPQSSNAGTATAFVRGTGPRTAANNGFAFFLERNRFRLAFGRGVAHVPLPPNGDSTRGMVLTDVTAELLGWQSAFVLVAVNNV